MCGMGGSDGLCGGCCSASALSHGIHPSDKTGRHARTVAFVRGRVPAAEAAEVRDGLLDEDGIVEVALHVVVPRDHDARVGVP